MPKNKKTLDPLPQTFDTLDEFIEFWDTHSTADYPEAFREIEGTTNVRERRFYRVALTRVSVKSLRNARGQKVFRWTNL